MIINKPQALKDFEKAMAQHSIYFRKTVFSTGLVELIDAKFQELYEKNNSVNDSAKPSTAAIVDRVANRIDKMVQACFASQSDSPALIAYFEQHQEQIATEIAEALYHFPLKQVGFSDIYGKYESYLGSLASQPLGSPLPPFPYKLLYASHQNHSENAQATVDYPNHKVAIRSTLTEVVNSHLEAYRHTPYDGMSVHQRM